MALGLDKVPPPTKSLEELLAEPEQEEPIMTDRAVKRSLDVITVVLVAAVVVVAAALIVAAVG